MNITTISGTVTGYKDAGSYHSVAIQVKTWKNEFQVNVHAGAELSNLKPGEVIVASGRLSFQKYNIAGVNQDRPVLKATAVARVGNFELLERERGEVAGSKTTATVSKKKENYDEIPW